jgi:RNA polymerase sigma-70 factor (ECF subfamily)
MDERDEELMAVVAEGDLSAFRLIVERHQKPLINFISRYLGDRTAAEDVAQEVFLRIFKAAKDYKPQAKFKTWLFTIATNLCLNEIRNSRSKPAFVELADAPEAEYPVIASDSFSPQKAAEKEELNAAVRKAIGELPENQRIAILLRQYHEFSYTEIGKIMGLSVPAVESLIQRARQNLKRQLTPFL